MNDESINQLLPRIVFVRTYTINTHLPTGKSMSFLNFRESRLPVIMNSREKTSFAMRDDATYHIIVPNVKFH